MTIKNIIFAAGSIASIQPNLLSTTYLNFETTYGTGNFTLGTPAGWGTSLVASKLSFSRVTTGDLAFVGATQTGTGKQGGIFNLSRNGSTTTWLRTSTNDAYLGNSVTTSDQFPGFYNGFLDASENCNVVAAMSKDAQNIQVFNYNTVAGQENVSRAGNLGIYRPSSSTNYNASFLSVSPDGQWIAYGSPNVNLQLNTANSRGSVGLWRSTDRFNTGSTVSFIVPTDPTANGFGQTVVIGGDSNVMVISEANASSKRVFVYNRSGTTWSQHQILSKPTITNGLFGLNMAVSRTASRLAVLEPSANVGGFSYTGQVHIYSNVTGTWQAEAVIQPSGTALVNNMYFGTYAMDFDEDGQTLLITAPGAYGAAGATTKGGGFVYKRGGGNTWNLVSNLITQMTSGATANSATRSGVSGTINYAGTEVLMASQDAGNTTSTSYKGAVFYFNLS